MGYGREDSSLVYNDYVRLVGGGLVDCFSSPIVRLTDAGGGGGIVDDNVLGSGLE